MAHTAGPIDRLVARASEPGDSELDHARKRVVVILCLIALGLMPFWAATYIALENPWAAAGPLFAFAECVVLLPYTLATKRTGPAILMIFVSLLVAPAWVHLSLGGFERSSGVIAWSMFAPLFAIVIASPRQARLWLLGFIVEILVVWLIGDRLAADAEPIDPTIRSALFVANLLTVLALMYVILQGAVRERDRARKQSEDLLLNVLPRSVADRLRKQPGVISERYDSISVLFADLVGFTPLSAKLSPQASVEMLNDIFSRFDRLVDRHGLEKIRTIGDGYMVAGGAPELRPDHAQAVAELALDLAEEVRALPEYHGIRIDIRIGLNSGPAVAGVIGRSKFHYDVWGDAVNVASRMETHGLPGRIHVAPGMHALIEDTFECEPRGPIDIKGKGKMETWFLVARKSSAK